MASYSSPFVWSLVKIGPEITKLWQYLFSEFLHENESMTLKNKSRSTNTREYDVIEELKNHYNVFTTFCQIKCQSGYKTCRRRRHTAGSTSESTAAAGSCTSVTTLSCRGSWSLSASLSQSESSSSKELSSESAVTAAKTSWVLNPRRYETPCWLQ